MKDILRLPMQFFADDGQDSEPPAPAESDGSRTESGDPVNFDQLIKTNKTFQSWFDAKIAQASNSAVQSYQRKQERLKNERLSEAEKLKGMSDSEKADYYRRLAEEKDAAFERFKNARDLRSQTVSMFSENNIPLEFLENYDFESMTADDVKNRVDLFSKYEIYPKGTFESKLADALNEKLKQSTPETHSPSEDRPDNKLRAAFGLSPM